MYCFFLQTLDDLRPQFYSRAISEIAGMFPASHFCFPHPRGHSPVSYQEHLWVHRQVRELDTHTHRSLCWQFLVFICIISAVIGTVSRWVRIIATFGLNLYVMHPPRYYICWHCSSDVSIKFCPFLLLLPLLAVLLNPFLSLLYSCYLTHHFQERKYLFLCSTRSLQAFNHRWPNSGLWPQRPTAFTILSHPGPSPLMCSLAQCSFFFSQLLSRGGELIIRRVSVYWKLL